MSDHGDHAIAEHDITDLFVFRKPGDPGKTILIMGVDLGVPPRSRAFDPDASYDFMVDTDDDAAPDIAFRVTFSSEAGGRQRATVRRATGRDAASGNGDGQIIVRDAPVSFDAEPLVTTEGEFGFFAGIRSDPFFVDVAGALNEFQWTGQDSVAVNNVFAIVLQVPNGALGENSVSGIWARVLIPHGPGTFLQADRAGRPFANGAFNRDDKEAQNVFNQIEPIRDRTLFLDRFVSYLERRGNYSAGEAQALARTLLPDILPYDHATDSQYPNGRTLTDDVADWTWALVTNGRATDDGIGPHTDLLPDFPYLGHPHPGS